MFEENKNNIEQDQLFRSILNEGTEPVPTHVWDSIEADLDKIAQRRKVIIWFRRTAVGVVAAAALAFGLFFNRGTSDDIISPVSGEGMIAVTKQENKIGEDISTIESGTNMIQDLIAMAEPVKSDKRNDITYKESSHNQELTTDFTESEQTTTQNKETPKTEKRQQASDTKEDKTATGRFDDIWLEDENSEKRNGVSLVLSGITGTNSAQNTNRVNPMRKPVISAAPQKTGIKETSTNTTYGIPVSAGVGIKIDLSPKWSIGTGINYTLLTRKFYGTYTEVGDSGSILRDISSDIRGSQHYIGIPVNLYYNIVSRNQINLYTYAGGTVEKCISDKYHVLNTDIVHTEKTKGIQLSADLGIGVEFMVGRHLGIYLDPSIRYYFDNNQPKSIRTAQPLMFGFEMGLRARL